MTMSKSLCWLLMFIIVYPLNGCTIMQAVEGGNDNLPSRIRAHKLVGEGDRVEIRTIDGQEYRFKVLDVDDETVRGDADSARIDDIAELSVRRFSGQRTVGLVVVILGLFVITAIAAANSSNNFCSGDNCAPDSSF